MAALGQLIEEMAKAGVLLATDGLQPSSKGARVRISGGKFTVTDGPFTETKELIAGYAIVQARSKAEAIELAKRFLTVMGEGESEIRLMHEQAAYGPESTPCPGRRSPMNNTGTLQVTTPTEREIVWTRVVDAPRRLVFEAWTSPEHLPLWMLGPSGWTMPVCEIDLRPGGAWHFVWRRSDGTEMGMRGVYQEITPPERLVSTESWGGNWAETLNTLMLSEEDGKTTITCRILYPSKEARDAALSTGMEQGVAASYDRLAELLASTLAQKIKRHFQ
jgi:uncharacterized protein YndB with AHSA1/START domain